MAQELDLETIEITNPTSEDFTQRFNGTPYSIKAGETKAFAKPVACHIAKHLSSRMIIDEEWGKFTPKQAEAARADHKHPVHLKVSQLQNYDTHERRIALYKIFGIGTLVFEVLQRYNFRSFIGDMSIYQAFLEKQKPAEPEEVKTA